MIVNIVRSHFWSCMSYMKGNGLVKKCGGAEQPCKLTVTFLSFRQKCQGEATIHTINSVFAVRITDAKIYENFTAVY
jgi:hypothetical protein